MGLGIGSKPYPLSHQTRIQNPIKVTLQKPPATIDYLHLNIFITYLTHFYSFLYSGDIWSIRTPIWTILEPLRS